MLDYTSGGGNSAEIDVSDPATDLTSKRMLKYAKPIPRKPKFADLHFLTQYAPVISGRLKNVLESLNLKEVQFLPAIIRDDKGNEHDNGFYIVHVYNDIKCLNKEKSDWEESLFNEEKVSEIDKLVLDNEVLDQIPLGERLIFALWEESSLVFYHRSVVEKILDIDPTGLTVYSISGYDSSFPFIESYLAKKNGGE